MTSSASSTRRNIGAVLSAYLEAQLGGRRLGLPWDFGVVTTVPSSRPVVASALQRAGEEGWWVPQLTDVATVRAGHQRQRERPGAERTWVKDKWEVDRAAVDGRDVLVLDDIYTSGGSIHSFAQALRQAGANSVRAIILARNIGADDGSWVLPLLRERHDAGAVWTPQTNKVRRDTPLMPTAETSTAETRAVVLVLRACLAARGVSGWQASAAIERVGSARRVLAGDFEPETRWELAVRAAVREAAPDAEADEQLAEEMDAWAAEDIRLVTVLDSDYPLNLRFIWDRPPVLWYRGLLEAEDAYALAVVGTRNPTDDGRRRARKMARLLAERGVTVLSGLAKGIDSEAHTATLEAGGRTVAVLGHGHHHMYPKENAALAEAIAEQGAVVSLFQPDTPPTRRTFPMRNVVTSGLGQGTAVIQASHTSGARLQARLARSDGLQWPHRDGLKWPHFASVDLRL